MDHIPGAEERLEACGEGRKRLIAITGETTEVAANRFALGLLSLLQEGRKTILLKPELAGPSRSLDPLK